MSTSNTPPSQTHQPRPFLATPTISTLSQSCPLPATPLNTPTSQAHHPCLLPATPTNYAHYLRPPTILIFHPLLDIYKTLSLTFSRMAGPVAPIDWMEETITTLCPSDSSPYRAKLLLGINFYGVKFSNSGAEPVINHEYK